MDGYNFTQNAETLQALFDKVQHPETAPTKDSENLATSGGIYAALAVKITTAISTNYADLVSLRNTQSLIPGQAYVISDFVTTVANNTEAQSAGHAFQVIVFAVTTAALSEFALAAPATDDQYFANANLFAWRLRYCLDNDVTRFQWADATNGKGVIYFMEDEHGNKAGYDFKNIQFKRYKITAFAKGQAMVGKYLGLRDVTAAGTAGTLYPSGATISTTDTAWRYTFDRNGADASLAPGRYRVANNAIAPLYFEQTTAGREPQYLNNLTFVLTAATAEVYNNVFSGYCHGMAFGSSTYANAFTGYVVKCQFSGDCFGNTFSGDVENNTFSGSVYRCTFSGYVGDCSFSGNVSYNTFSGYLDSNSFSGYVQESNFSGDMYNNSFSGSVDTCSFSGYVSYSTFSGNCYNNSFSGNVEGCSFSGYCNYNSFSGNVVECSFSGNLKYSQFEGYAEYCAFNGGSTDATTLQHVRQTGRITGEDEDNLLTVTADLGKPYEQIITADSSGDLVIKKPWL